MDKTVVLRQVPGLRNLSKLHLTDGPGSSTIVKPASAEPPITRSSIRVRSGFFGTRYLALKPNATTQA